MNRGNGKLSIFEQNTLLKYTDKGWLNRESFPQWHPLVVADMKQDQLRAVHHTETLLAAEMCFW
jgi:hypothetical protein